MAKTKKKKTDQVQGEAPGQVIVDDPIQQSGPEYISIGDLVPDPKNARIHTPRTIGAIVDSIQAAGIGRGIVIDENNVILAGNGAVEGAMEAIGAGAKVLVIDQDKAALTVVRRTGMTEAQKVRLALDDNRAAEHSKFDPDVLKGMKADFPTLEIIGTLWTPVEFAIATSPLVPYVPQKVSKPTGHNDRRPELRLGKTAVPFTPEEDARMDTFLLLWIDKFGSTSGSGPAIANALLSVVEADDAVKALDS